VRYNYGGSIDGEQGFWVGDDANGVAEAGEECRVRGRVPQVLTYDGDGVGDTSVGGFVYCFSAPARPDATRFCIIERSFLPRLPRPMHTMFVMRGLLCSCVSVLAKSLFAVLLSHMSMACCIIWYMP
jgi:hypothetical protein